MNCDKWSSGCDAPWYCLVSDRLTAGCKPAEVWDALFYADWLLYVTIGLVALAAFTLATSVFPGFHASGRDPLDVRFGHRRYRLHYAVGRITESRRDAVVDSTTTTTYNEYGGFSHQTRSRVSAWTTTWVTYPNGTAAWMDTGSFSVTVGGDLYHLWAIKRDQQRGPFILFLNHATDRFCVNKREVKKMLRPSRLPLLLITLAQALVLRQFAIVTIPLVAIAYLLLGSPVTAYRLVRFGRHIQNRVLPVTAPTRMARVTA